MKQEAKKQKAFTLIELIVVMTILVILGTLAFISFEGYSSKSRNSVRITDVANLKESLELYSINTGLYPSTDSGEEVTYGGEVAWVQGTVGDKVMKELSKNYSGDKIIDPLTELEYTYSVIKNKKEYQIGGVIEGDFAYRGGNNFIDSVYAGKTKSIALINGKYNGEILTIKKGEQKCLIASPSIITSNGKTLEDISSNNYFVYDKGGNLPKNYVGTRYDLGGEQNLKLVNGDKIELYCGKLENLATDESQRLDYLQNLQDAYSGTVVENTGNVKDVSELEIDDSNPSIETKKYAIKYVEDVLGENVSESQKEKAGKCNLGYHKEGSKCEANKKSCNIANGIGEQTWNGSAFGECVVISCNNGYTSNSKKCIKNTWNTSSFGSCSKSCGGGTQTRTVKCIDFDSNVLADSKCIDSKPSVSQSCNTQSCYTYSWYTSSRSSCSASAYWGSRGSCSKSCGGGRKYRTCYGRYGSRSRSVYCRRSDGNRVSSSYCSGSKPSTSTSCSDYCSGSSQTSCNTQSCACYITRIGSFYVADLPDTGRQSNRCVRPYQYYKSHRYMKSKRQPTGRDLRVYCGEEGRRNSSGKCIGRGTGGYDGEIVYH